jgi:hypothetical protein
MDGYMQMGEAVRQACIAAALQAYDDAGVSGLCHEGRWEYAVDAMRGLPLRQLIEALLRAAEHEEGGGHSSLGTCTRACVSERRQDGHPATQRPVSDDGP